MTIRSFRHALFMALFGTAPLLLGANGKGCSGPATSADGGESDAGGVVGWPVDAGASDGAAALEAAPTPTSDASPDASAADAETPDDAGGGASNADANGDDASGETHVDASADGGVCVANEGGHCGGFVACPCAAGLQCVPQAPGDEGGTCEKVDDAGASSGAPCTTATDCHGALPQICVAPSPGDPAGGCAHWACVDGHCKIQIGQ
jgi:hypothetical protein